MIYRPETWKQHFPLSTFQAHIPVHIPCCSFAFPCGWLVSKRMICLLAAWDMFYHWFWDKGFIFLSHFWVCWVFNCFFCLIPQEALCFSSSCFCCTAVAWSSRFPEPWACCGMSKGWDHPSAVPADWGVMGASGARGFSTSVGSWAEKCDGFLKVPFHC